MLRGALSTVPSPVTTANEAISLVLAVVVDMFKATLIRPISGSRTTTEEPTLSVEMHFFVPCLVNY